MIRHVGNELEVLSVEAQRLFHLIHAFPTRTGDLLERQVLYLEREGR